MNKLTVTKSNIKSKCNITILKAEHWIQHSNAYERPRSSFFYILHCCMSGINTCCTIQIYLFVYIVRNYMDVNHLFV